MILIGFTLCKRKPCFPLCLNGNYNLDILSLPPNPFSVGEKKDDFDVNINDSF